MEKTVKDVFNELTEEQKSVVSYMMQVAFENGLNSKSTVEHSMLIDKAKKSGSLRQAELELIHDGYGIDSIDNFVGNYELTDGLIHIKHPSLWVSIVLERAQRFPFTKLRSVYADLTENQLRAYGYEKGNYKGNNAVSLVYRETNPQTVIVKHRMDRADINDITSMDIVNEVKTMMSLRLSEELVRAILIGDGRSSGDSLKISEDSIRPIATDLDFYTIKQYVEYSSDPEIITKNIVKSAWEARENYLGSGNLVMFINDTWLTNLMTSEDGVGNKLYHGMFDLTNSIGVDGIASVPYMKTQTITLDSEIFDIIGIIVDPADYGIGIRENNSNEFFSDFDIDYNQNVYMMESRLSGALIRPMSAILLYTDHST